MGQTLAQTPACNTGATDPLAPPPLSAFEWTDWPLGVWRWDWARATVPAHHEALMQAIQQAAGRRLERVPGKGRFNYDSRVDFMLGDERIATVLFGGRNGNPNVEASHDRADWLVALLKASRLDWMPTRLDPCIDFCRVGLYDEFRAVALQIAQEFRTPNGQAIKFREISSPIDAYAGRTFYLGSRSGRWFLRVYEKGLMDWAPGPDGNVPPETVLGLVRVEAEIKPDSREGRRLAAEASPMELFGVSPVLRAFAERALNVTIEPISLQVRRESSRDKALLAMGGQYQRYLSELMAECQGDFEAFGEAIARYAGLLQDDAKLAG